MYKLFPYAGKALANTQEIAERCNVELTFGEYKLPEFDVPVEYNALEYLSALCEQGLKERYVEVTTDLSDRLNYEIETINNMGFVDYLLLYGLYKVCKIMI